MPSPAATNGKVRTLRFSFSGAGTFYLVVASPGVNQARAQCDTDDVDVMVGLTTSATALPALPSDKTANAADADLTAYETRTLMKNAAPQVWSLAGSERATHVHVRVSAACKITLGVGISE